MVLHQQRLPFTYICERRGHGLYAVRKQAAHGKSEGTASQYGTSNKDYLTECRNCRLCLFLQDVPQNGGHLRRRISCPVPKRMTDLEKLSALFSNNAKRGQFKTGLHKETFPLFSIARPLLLIPRKSADCYNTGHKPA